MATETEVVARNAAVDAIGALADDGYIRIYGKPPGHLAELRLASPAFPPAVGGVLTAKKITKDRSARATGKAERYSVLKADGSTKLWKGTVTDKNGDGDMKLDKVNIQEGAEVAIDSLTYTLPAK